MVTVDSSAAAAQYAAILTQLEPRCQESRRGIADLSAKVRSAVKQTSGREVSLMDVLRGMERAIPGGAAKINCTDIATAVGLLLSRQ